MQLHWRWYRVMCGRGLGFINHTALAGDSAMAIRVSVCAMHCVHCACSLARQSSWSGPFGFRLQFQPHSLALAIGDCLWPLHAEAGNGYFVTKVAIIHQPTS